MGIATWITTGEEVPVNKKRIVVVDDEEECLKTMRLALVMAGYSVNAFCRADEALDYLLGSFSGSMPFDLLVTDIRMPGMNGWELAQRLQERQPGLRVLFITGYTPDAILQQGIALEPDLVLQKPFAQTALVARVQALLAEA